MPNIKDNARIENERFFKKVDTHNESEEECWEWRGAIEGGGYGSFRSGGKSVRAHRFAYELTEKIPEGKMVLHICDNRLCVNPYHLFLGDAQDNSDDCRDKGRMIRAFGENHGNSKFKNNDIEDIRQLYQIGFTQGYIAGRYGVDRSTIGYIVRGDYWRKV